MYISFPAIEAIDKPVEATLPPTLPIVETEERIEDDELRLLDFINDFPDPLIKNPAKPIYIL